MTTAWLPGSDTRSSAVRELIDFARCKKKKRERRIFLPRRPPPPPPFFPSSLNLAHLIDIPEPTRLKLATRLSRRLVIIDEAPVLRNGRTLVNCSETGEYVRRRRRAKRPGHRGIGRETLVSHRRRDLLVASYVEFAAILSQRFSSPLVG